MIALFTMLTPLPLCSGVTAPASLYVDVVTRTYQPRLELHMRHLCCHTKKRVGRYTSAASKKFFHLDSV